MPPAALPYFFHGCFGAAAPIASPGEKLAQNRLFATDFVTEVESGQTCFDKVAASGLGMGNPLAGLSVVPFCGRTVREAGPYSLVATKMCHPERSAAESKDPFLWKIENGFLHGVSPWSE